MRTSICILEPSDPAIATLVVDLQRAAYAVEAQIIGFDGIPQLRESVNDLIKAPESWIGVWDNRRLVGALSFQVDGEHLDICRLVVDPGAFRRGYGTALVEEVRRIVPHAVVTVSTGADNAPAVRLYQKLDFIPFERHEIAPGVEVISLSAQSSDWSV